MPPPDRYSRVYFKVKVDPKFETVYDDDRHLATWLRLLLDAEASWPEWPTIPQRTRKASLAVLVAVGLVDLMPRGCYRIHGLDAERTARAQQGKHAAAVRWQNGSSAGSNAQSIAASSAPLMHVRERVQEEDEDEKSTLRARESDFDVDLWGRVMTLSEELTGVAHGLRSPYSGIGTQALSQATSTSWPKFEAAWRKVAAVYGKPTVRQLVLDSEDHLRPLGRAKPAGPSKEERERAEARKALGLDS